MRRWMDGEPNYTCPIIDEAIEKMEDVRKANDGLREWGRGNAERAEQLEEEVSDLEQKVGELEALVEELRAEISSLEMKLENRVT